MNIIRNKHKEMLLLCCHKFINIHIPRFVMEVKSSKFRVEVGHHTSTTSTRMKKREKKSN